MKVLFSQGAYDTKVQPKMLTKVQFSQGADECAAQGAAQGADKGAAKGADEGGDSLRCT
jgi:hypothetical protein